jgi:hypothetical protein
LSYDVVVQCLSQILCPSMTDAVVTKIESGEGLWENLDEIKRLQTTKIRCLVLIVA